MTIKTQIKWFVGLPAAAIIFWSIIALILFGAAPNRLENPACNIPKIEWNDMVADECSGDMYGYATAGVLTLDIISVGLLIVGTVSVLGSKGFKLVKKSKKS